MTVIDPELRELLHRLEDLAPPAPPFPPTRTDIAVPQASRHCRIAVVASLLFFIIAVAGLAWARHPRPSATTPIPTTATVLPSTLPTVDDLRHLLGNQVWRLTQLNGAPTSFDLTLRVLANGDVGGSAACNDYGIRESTSPDRPHWTFESSAVSCGSATDHLAADIATALTTTTTITHDGSDIILHGSGGTSLRFEQLGTPTAIGGDPHFVLPARLTHSAKGWVSTMEAVSWFYSNVELGASCKGGWCGWPIQALPADSIVMSWGNTNGMSLSTGQPEGMAPNATIAGQDATITRSKPGECAAIGGTESIVVMMHGDTKMRACLRGPHLAPLEHDVESMLQSVTFG